jgi:two-component system response regulator CpxR
MSTRGNSVFFSNPGAACAKAFGCSASYGNLPSGEDNMTASRLLIIDDDVRLTEMLTEYLAGEGIELRSASSGMVGLRDAQRNDYDLVILDVMLPGLSGFEVLRQMRDSGSRTPVLMLTARGDDVDRIVGLEMGADDYLSKPFNPRELAARIKAILRRTTDDLGTDVSEIEVGPLRAHLPRREIALDNRPLRLTNAEFVVLVTLMRTPGQTVSREALTRAALGRQLLPDDRSLDTHISNLRKKINDGSERGLQIRSIRGSGYVLVPPESDT